MNKDTNIQRTQKEDLGDIEFVIDRYFEQHIYPLFDDCVREVSRKSKKELANAEKVAKKEAENPSLPGMMSDARRMQHGFVINNIHKTGNYTDGSQDFTYTNKTTDEILESLIEKVENNKRYAQDFVNLRYFLADFLSDGNYFSANKSSQKIWDAKADEYLRNRFNQNLVRLTAKRNMPSNVAEYFIKKALSSGTYADWVELASPTSRRYYSGSTYDDAWAYTSDVIQKKYRFGGLLDFGTTEALQFLGEAPLYGGYGKGVQAISSFMQWAGFDLGMEVLPKVAAKHNEQNYYLFFNNSTQTAFAEKISGNTRWLDWIEGMGLNFENHDKNLIEIINNTLENKIDTAPENIVREKLRVNLQYNLLTKSSGSNQKLRRLIKDELDIAAEKTSGFNFITQTKLYLLSNSKDYDKWMEKVDWQQCNHRAAFWASQLHYMAEYGLKYRKFGNKKFSIEEVADHAISYANAAVHNLREKQMVESLKKKTEPIRYDIIKKSGDSPAKTRDYVRQGLYKLKMYAGMMDNHIPAWMYKIKHSDCQKYAAYFIARAQAVKEAGGEKEHYKSLAQKAWYYAQAACKNMQSEKASKTNNEQIHSYKQQFLTQAHGSNQKLRNAIRAEISKVPRSGSLVKSMNYDPWMMKMSWQNLHRQAAYWAGVLRKMNKEGLDSMEISGKTFKKWDIAIKAINYANGAYHKLVSTQKSAAKNKTLSDFINTNKASILRQAGGNNKKLHSLINKELFGKTNAIKPSIPKWMSCITSAQCRASAAYYCSIAKWMKSNHQSAVIVGHKRLDLNEVIIQACQYGAAAEQNIRVKAQSKPQPRKKVQQGASVNANTKSILSNKNILLSRSGGSNYDLRKLIYAEIKGAGLRVNANKSGYSAWMKTMSWQQCRNNAAFFAAALMQSRALKSGGITVGKTYFSRAQLADRAMQYANAAIDNLQRQHTPPKTSSKSNKKAAGSPARQNNVSHSQGNNASQRPHKDNKVNTPQVPSKNTQSGSQQTGNTVSRPGKSYIATENRNTQNEKVVSGPQPHSFKTTAYENISSRPQPTASEKDNKDTTMKTQKTSYSDSSASERTVTRHGHKEISAPADETIHPAKVQNRSNCFIVMSKKDYYCYVYEKRGNENVMVARYDCAFGVNKGDKTRTGDGKTPSCSMEHPFHIQNIENSTSWKHDFHDGRGSIKSYGDWFLRLSLDGHKMQGNNSIGIHGSTNNAESVPGRASEGCIRLKDEDIRDLKEHYAFKGMKVIIKDESEDDLPFEVETMKKQGITRRRHYSNGINIASSPSQAQTNTQSDTRSLGKTITYNGNPSQGQGQYSGASQQPGAGNPLNFLGGQNNPWGQYINSVMPNGFSDVFKHIGYVMAMLPDLLIGIFTGRTGFSLKNNLLPMALVAMSFFTPKKHPLMKLMFLGVAGAAILNNAGKRIIRESGIDEGEKKQPLQRYKVYDDEPLNPRIKNPVVKGNMMLADIDGVPNVIAISSMAIDAYEKKALPLNTLANAVLAKYDEQKEAITNNVNQQVTKQENIKQAAVMK